MLRWTSPQPSGPLERCLAALPGGFTPKDVAKILVIGELNREFGTRLCLDHTDLPDMASFQFRTWSAGAGGRSS